MEINKFVEKAHENAVEHGFYDFVSKNKISSMRISIEKGFSLSQRENDFIGNRLLLIVSEAAEAQKGLRNKDMSNFKEELADIAIRLGDLCGLLDIDLEAEIEKKMEINKSREYKHGKAF